jgi:hypothetical protein
MAVVAQARDLPQTQLAFEEAHGLVVQEIVHPAPVELGASSDVSHKLYGDIGPAFYGLRTTLLTLVLMALLRIKRPEQLKER